MRSDAHLMMDREKDGKGEGGRDRSFRIVLGQGHAPREGIQTNRIGVNLVSSRCEWGFLRFRPKIGHSDQKSVGIWG